MNHLNDGDTVKADDAAPGEGEFWITGAAISDHGEPSSWSMYWLVQGRFPKSKKRRIRKKWAQRSSNWKWIAEDAPP